MSRSNLKLIKLDVFVGERPIIATMQYGYQRQEIRRKRIVRRYKTLDNALTLATAWMRRDGYVKDMIVIHHELTGLELGTIRMNAQGHLVEKWVWDSDF